MTCFQLPKWVLNRIDQIRQSFLWGKNDVTKRGVSLINWETVIRPIEWGGMGLRNLYIHNIALLLRWWWRAYNNQKCLWTHTITIIRWTGIYATGPNFWSVTGSFFWKKLLALRPIFNASITWIIGNGKSISYWYDSWNGAPLATLLEEGQRPVNPKLSLCDAYPIRNMLHEEVVVMEDITFNQSCDRMEWKWSEKGVYTAKSIYTIISGIGLTKPLHTCTWKLIVPPTVRIFIYLLLKRKILTMNVMSYRNMGVNSGCVICENCPTESALHLIFLCPCAVEVWYEMAAKIGYRLMVPHSTILEIWTVSKEQANRRGRKCRVEWGSYFACTCWHLWKRRNEKIFTGKSTPSNILAERIFHEGRMWLTFCNMGGA